MLDSIRKLSNSEVFTVILDDEPEQTKYWFRATELCEVLFHQTNSYRYIKKYCLHWQYREFQVGVGRPAMYICESGVYRLLINSKSPVALDFQAWLTEVLLPKLRGSGGYIMPTATSEQLQALQAEISALQKRLQYLENDHRYELLVKAFVAQNIEYKRSTGSKKIQGFNINKDNYLLVAELFERVRWWLSLPENVTKLSVKPEDFQKDVFMVELDRHLKSIGKDKTLRPYIDSTNGYGDLENAVLVEKSRIVNNPYLFVTAEKLGE
jgi:prophage antirepressor-like protein